MKKENILTVIKLVDRRYRLSRNIIIVSFGLFSVFNLIIHVRTRLN